MVTQSRIDAIERATGRSWDDWLVYMERIQAERLDHHEIATRLLLELDGTVANLGWWAQATAVAYEHHIGRRIPGQQPDGSFRLSVSRATPLDMRALMDRWGAFAERDADALAMIVAEPRVSGTERRITWRAKGVGDTAITVISEPTPRGTASLVVQHGGLPSPESSAETRARWQSALDRFVAALPARDGAP